ncbi:hypothetical protein MMYC01_202664 [Madurella mycetomatis]|uniref:Aminoglycoside phosphotransferase domain-containing protein n=1 Tax=Madurella mycetomatis TaxID=100816 RepID=A0A175WE87_9PEZI|nr:hypothetical protein MMYC01_202664 [Madurella mycetomatis]
MPSINSDNDLPNLLNAPTKQVVVQFRTERLDLDAFKTARRALGEHIVPQVGALNDEEPEAEGAWAYWLTKLPGKMWLHGVASKGAEGRIAVNKSLGRLFAQGRLANDSGEAVVSTVRPHLDAILASSINEIMPYRQMLLGFHDKLDEIAKLPLWVTHYDLNAVNVLIDEDCKVSGLIDWELSKPKPFSVVFGRIHTIAGEFTGGEFWMPDEFEDAERGFWRELFDGLPQKTRAMLEKNIDLVQEAVILGTLLDAFFWEDGKVGCGQVTIKALPKFITYRIPLG